MLAALVGAGMTALRVPVAAHIAVVAVLGTMAVLWATGQFLVDDSATAHAETQHPKAGRTRSAWIEPRTLLIGLMVLAAAFAEGTANDWMAVAFVDGHGVDKALGVVALAVFLTLPAGSWAPACSTGTAAARSCASCSSPPFSDVCWSYSATSGWRLSVSPSGESGQVLAFRSACRRPPTTPAVPRCGSAW